jgi:hypothetical protein
LPTASIRQFLDMFAGYRVKLLMEFRPPSEHDDKIWHWIERVVWPGYWNIVQVKWAGGFWHPGARDGVMLDGAWPPEAAYRNGWIYIRPCEDQCL